jgi:hypothetical protein
MFNGGASDLFKPVLGASGLVLKTSIVDVWEIRMGL